MKIKHFDRGEGELKVEPQSLEDLWYLTKIIDEKDVVRGRSTRLWKPEDINRPGTSERKPVKLEIEVEKVEFAQAANKLRITGVILKGEPEEICPRGEHHTLDIEPNQVFEVKKEFNAYHEAMLDEAKKRSRHLKISIVAIDEEKALFVELETKGLAFGPEVNNAANKRDPKSFDEKNAAYFKEVAETIKRKNPGRILIAGPGFAKDNLKKLLNHQYKDVAAKCVYEYTSNAEKPGVFELLKKGMLQKLLKEQKLQDEFEALERFKTSLGRSDGLSAYGEKVGDAVQSGAASELLVTDEVLRKDKKIQDILTKAKQLGARITIFNSDDEAGQEFKAFKIAALLRYKVDWQ